MFLFEIWRWQLSNPRPEEETQQPQTQILQNKAETLLQRKPQYEDLEVSALSLGLVPTTPPRLLLLFPLISWTRETTLCSGVALLLNHLQNLSLSAAMVVKIAGEVALSPGMAVLVLGVIRELGWRLPGVCLVLARRQPAATARCRSARCHGAGMWLLRFGVILQWNYELFEFFFWVLTFDKLSMVPKA